MIVQMIDEIAWFGLDTVFIGWRAFRDLDNLPKNLHRAKVT